MSTKKDRRKARRRAEKMMEDAWIALRAGNTGQAERASRAAIDLGFVNPRLWLDRGQILYEIGDAPAAEEAVRHAIAIAPRYAEAFVRLAELLARQGRFAKAGDLLGRALELGTLDDVFREEALVRLASFGVIACEADEQGARFEHDALRDAPTFTRRTERYDWDAIERDLVQHGACKVEALLDTSECDELIELWELDELFEHAVSLDDERGRVEYRFLSSPLPSLVVATRSEVYSRVAVIANRCNELLGRDERFSLHHDVFLERCRKAGQRRSTAILLRYGRGGFNAPHRDVAGREVFPFQCAITLSATRADGDGDDPGGAFVLVDQRLGKKRRQLEMATRPGDAVIFATRERVVHVGGYPGLVTVAHGIREVHAEARFALGVPFHSYA
ncbi:MAG: 2OG-Fe(II) oxygenase [Planctomycetes bacterium]|nr:2OG-Fe(II) oxygenase [Planctomycetota bacterium]MCB9920167.1 2OG-Fe(II) oxygenase [Planctomycetota bacterium]